MSNIINYPVIAWTWLREKQTEYPNTYQAVALALIVLGFWF